MKLRAVLLALLSVGVLLWLVRGIGWSPILAAVSRVGPAGFAGLLLFQLALALPAALAWAMLVWPVAPLPFRLALWGRLVRDAAGQALPFTALGGGAIGAHTLTSGGVRVEVAAVSTFMDLVVEFVSQLLYIALGAVLLDRLRAVHAPPWAAIAGALALLVGVLLATLGPRIVPAGAVRALGRRVRRWVGAERLQLLGRAAAVPRAPGAALAAATLHLSAWVLTGVQTWLMFRLLGVRLNLGPAVVVDSLTTAARAAAFLVPSGIGVQEGAIVLLGQMFGVTPATGLALALVRRGRDLALAVPILLAWQARLHWAGRPDLRSGPSRPEPPAVDPGRGEGA